MSPNNTQRAIKTLIKTIESPVLNGYLRKELEYPDMALLAEARGNADVFEHITMQEQLLLRLMLDLWSNDEHVTIGEILQHADADAFRAVLAALGHMRGEKITASLPSKEAQPSVAGE